MIQRVPVGAVLLDAEESRYIAKALDLLGELLAQRRDEHGQPAPSTPTPKLLDVTRRLQQASKASHDANGSHQSVTGSGIVRPPRDETGQPVLMELATGAAARILGVTPAAVRALGRRGRLPARWSGTRWKFDALAVEARAARNANRRAG